MQLTYNEALETVIDYTEMGYTLASQDRLWIVFIYDLWSDGNGREWRYNPLYTRGIGKGWGYDRTIPGVLVWTTRREAEDFAQELRGYLAGEWQQSRLPESGVPEVYVMNLGDDARYEDLVLGGSKRARTSPKYKGSERAWQAKIEMSRRWVEANGT